MFCIVLEFSSISKGKDPKNLNWAAIHSFFEYLFPDDFVCVLKPYNKNDGQAKVFFKQKVDIPDGSNPVEIDSFLASIVDCHNEENLSATRTRVQRLPARPDNLDRIVSELKERLKVRATCLPDTDSDDGASVILSLTGCHEEVLEAALDSVARLLKSAASGTSAGATGGTSDKLPQTAATADSPATAAPVASSRRPRKPLFSPDVIAAADAREAEEATKMLQQPQHQPPQQNQQQPSPQQQYSKPVPPLSQSIAFDLIPNCRLTIERGDLTRIDDIDLLVASTNGTLSLRHGLAKALATKWGFNDIETECQRHLRSVRNGQIPFGGSFLSHKGQILFVVLPNDRRLMEGPLGRGREIRRAVDSCLDDTMKQLVRLAGDDSAPGFKRVAMPTLGSTLPLWGEGRDRDEWADALAGALARLARAPRGAGHLRELRVCCVSDEAARLLGNAVAVLLGAGADTASAASSHGNRVTSAATSTGASRQPPVDRMDVDEDLSTAAPTATEGSCILCADEFSAKNAATPFHCQKPGDQLMLCARCVARLTDPTQPSDGKCVVCFERYRPAVGNQPPGGRMHVATESDSLPGHEGPGTIVINYEFDSGILDGNAYKGIHRTAYLPDSDEGRNLLQRLQTAFAGRVVFSIGASATTGRQTAITWNTVHHKTSKSGGASRHGYPDQDYLQRTSRELSDLGY